MPRCTNCRSHVTVQFARVFGDNEDVVHECIDCVPNGRLGEASEDADAGAASDADADSWLAGRAAGDSNA